MMSNFIAILFSTESVYPLMVTTIVFTVIFLWAVYFIEKVLK